MKPFLLFGGSSKQQRDYVLEVVRKNSWNLIELEKSNLDDDLRKTTITSTLSGKLNLFYVTTIDNLTPQQLEKLIKYSESSPHRFIFSVRYLYKIPKDIQKETLLIRTGEVVQEEFFQALTALMSEPDRNKVRDLLLNPNVNIPNLLKILDENAWKVSNSDVQKSLDACNQLLYKVDNEYLASILAYSFPVVKIPISIGFHKRKLYKEEKAILFRLRRRFRLNQKESLDLYNCVLQILPLNPNLGFSLAEELGLTEDERKFLKIDNPPQTSPPQIFASKTESLNNWI